MDSTNVLYGAEEAQVGEQNLDTQSIVVFEFEVYPEAKFLSPKTLDALYLTFGSNQKVGDLIGASEAFVRQTRRVITE